MKINRKFIWVIGILSIVAMSFQNCSRVNFSPTPQIETNPSTQAVDPDPFPSGGDNAGGETFKNCLSQNVSWTVAGATCTATATALNHGVRGVGVNDSVASTTGTARVSCSNGIISVDSSPAPTCVSTNTGGTDPVIYARPQFTSTIYHKSSERFGYMATGFKSTKVSLLTYCVQTYTGSVNNTSCDNPANFRAVSAAQAPVSWGYFPSSPNVWEIGIAADEVFLIFDLSAIPVGYYNVRLKGPHLTRDFGWVSVTNNRISFAEQSEMALTIIEVRD